RQSEGVHLALCISYRPISCGIDQEHGTSLDTVRQRSLVDRRRSRAITGRRWDAQQVEQVNLLKPKYPGLVILRASELGIGQIGTIAAAVRGRIGGGFLGPRVGYDPLTVVISLDAYE